MTGLIQWVEKHGYFGGLILHPVNPSLFNSLIFGRPGEPMFGARIGDSLVWDGEKIITEPRST